MHNELNTEINRLGQRTGKFKLQLDLFAKQRAAISLFNIQTVYFLKTVNCICLDHPFG